MNHKKVDVMNKDFPIEYVERNAIVFYVSTVKGRDNDTTDIDILKVKSDICLLLFIQALLKR